MRALLATLLCLAGCTAQPRPATPVKPVVILGNRTAPAVCECPDTAVEHARAERWKAYAEKLETALGLPHEKGDKP